MSPKGRSLLVAIRSHEMSNPSVPINGDGFSDEQAQNRALKERDTGWITVKTSVKSLFKAITGVGGLSGRCGKDGQGSFCCYCHHQMKGQIVFSKDGDIYLIPHVLLTM